MCIEQEFFHFHPGATAISVDVSLQIVLGSANFSLLGNEAGTELREACET